MPIALSEWASQKLSTRIDRAPDRLVCLLRSLRLPIRDAPGALDALASDPPCPDPFSAALRKTHPLASVRRYV